ncbi:MAG: phosphosulfolactate synthase [Methanobacterium sp.]
MNAFNFLTEGRERKSGEGLTMMLDKGMGPVSLIDFLELSGDYVDLAKFGWGTSAIQDRDLVKEKTEIYRSYDVIPYPGGTLFEIAYQQDKVDEFLSEADELSFDAIELSDGTINIDQVDRGELIGIIKDYGFRIITEVGKKNPVEDHNLSMEKRIEMVNFDLDAGAYRVLIEGREGGKGIGIYDNNGKVKDGVVDELSQKLDTSKIIWEAPKKDQQVYLILKFGPNVNLGNIAPKEIIALETLRQGLRGDTFGKVKL